MHTLNLAQLSTFIKVTELGSFSAAADYLDLSQPAVSLQIRQLEQLLGVRLLERVGRKVSATAAGEELLRHAYQIQQQVDIAWQSLSPHQHGSVGRLRIGTGATACIYLLPPLLQQLKQHMPGLDITVQTGNSSDILKRLENNVLDLALVTMPVNGRAFAWKEICCDEFVAVYPESQHHPDQTFTAESLAEMPLLLYEAGGNTRNIIDQWFTQAGQVVKPIMELGSVEAIKRLTAAGLGWSILPHLAVQDATRSDGLKIHPLNPRLERTLALAMRQDKPVSKGMRCLIGLLRQKDNQHS
ncbi:LysR family transcriptional regulator [Gynuella sunshinyii]|uniref:Transcriptional regulator n=1 Tax=Gynuella sunshinyii YC6258 TaxID=1445510 RepID=A0A0C5UYP2_9GAMM|nr:LysR family transcriptional regulator [Gynuella sunshinyii]AJQ92435.1 transcriptional regulator [Gynuella sunshinyii YC6258]